VWQADQETFNEPEHWSSFSEDVLHGKIFYGDCDNFALTCAELLVIEGFEKKDIRIALCWTETNEYHAVCVYKNEVLDNRHRRVIPFNEIKYKWHKSMRLDELKWRKS
jgi:predicted transglutaminase-like cysteine proteinase